MYDDGEVNVYPEEDPPAPGVLVLDGTQALHRGYVRGGGIEKGGF